MIKKLKRIAPVKFGIVMGAIYFLMVLVFVPFFALALIAGSFSHSDSSTGMSIGVGIIGCVVAPFLYAFFGFIFGALAALVYNLVAKFTGGIEFEVE